MARRGPRWRALASVGVACVAVLVTACSGPASRPTGHVSAPASGPGCSLSAKAVPSCGVLWGVSTRPPTVDTLHALEQKLGRPFDLVYRYHDVNDPVPDADERELVSEGRLLHIAIAARDFAQGTRGSVTWRDVAAGRYDTTLSAQARGIASLRVPVFVTFEQEANQRKKLDVVGTPADFKAAWRHLHELYVAAGATNAVWTWVMTGAEDNLDRALALWPGNDVVDWISWNVYNQSGCNGGTVDPRKFVSFSEKLRVFYDFVHGAAAAHGVDADKPMMVSEAGSVQYPTQLDLTAGWYASIPQVLRQYPQIKAVALWDSATSTCNYDFDGVEPVLAAVRQAGRDPWIDVRGAVRPHG
ncbi:MAG TPA: hypothetical protein VFL94_07945 [Actinomycetales bacterium]|nr:hypothetical protein [Actinomycetales bacterium]